MVHDGRGVIRYAISDGHGSDDGYLRLLGWCAYGAHATLHTLGTSIYFLYISSKIAYLGSYTYKITESNIYLCMNEGEVLWCA